MSGKPVLGLLPVLSLMCVAIASGNEQELDILISAGEYNRYQVPITVPVLEDEEGSIARLGTLGSVALRDEHGHEIPAQLTAPGILSIGSSDKRPRMQIHFILDELKKHEKLKLKAQITDQPQEIIPAPKRSFITSEDETATIDLALAGRPVLRYVFPTLDESSPARRQETYKPFHHLFSPDGSRLLTKGPGGLFTHHRGLFFGFNKVTYGAGKSVDIWHCTGKVFQEHQQLGRELGCVLGRLVSTIAWHGRDGEVFAREKREVTAYNIEGGTMIDFVSRVDTLSVPIRLDGDPQHAGFHFRAAQEVAESTKNQTIYIRPDGVGEPGETRNWIPKTGQGPVNLPWNGMSFVVGGQRYTVAYLDRPQNPKEARYSERDYGRFGSYFEYTIDQETPLVVAYRIWLQDGMMEPTEIARLSTDFVQPVEVLVSHP